MAFYQASNQIGSRNEKDLSHRTRAPSTANFIRQFAMLLLLFSYLSSPFIRFLSTFRQLLVQILTAPHFSLA